MLGDSDAEGLKLGDSDAEGLRLGDSDAEGLRLGDSLGDSETDSPSNPIPNSKVSPAIKSSSFVTRILPSGNQVI